MAERRRPVLQLSPLREASRIALTSVVFSGVALALVGAVRSIQPDWMPDPGALLADPASYAATEYRLLVRALAVQVGTASLFAGLASWAYYREKGSGLSLPHDTLWTVFHHKRPKGTVPVVDLLTSSGCAFRGRVFAFDPTGPSADRFIALRAPILLRREGETELAEQHRMWQRCVIPIDQIVELHVAFSPAEDQAR